MIPVTIVALIAMTIVARAAYIAAETHRPLVAAMSMFAMIIITVVALTYGVTHGVLDFLTESYIEPTQVRK